MILLPDNGRPQFGWELRRTVLCGLEKLVRKVVFQIREIHLRKFEIAVERCPEKNLKLCSVNLVTVHLLVIETYAAEDDFGCKDLLALRAQCASEDSS
jgi:hypothetical protein